MQTDPAPAPPSVFLIRFLKMTLSLSTGWATLHECLPMVSTPPLLKKSDLDPCDSRQISKPSCYLQNSWKKTTTQFPKASILCIIVLLPSSGFCHQTGANIHQQSPTGSPPSKQFLHPFFADVLLAPEVHHARTADISRCEFLVVMINEADAV